MGASNRFPERGLSLADARAAIEALRGQEFVNRGTGIAARLSSSAKGKLVSNKATSKSKANGFSREQHNILAANVGTLFVDARLVESRPDRVGDANVISIKRFARNVFFGYLEAVAWITIKESRQHGHHIYSVEAIKVEALDRKVEVVSGNTPHASSASTGNKIASSEKAVKWALEIVWIAGTMWVAFGLGSIVANIHETVESFKYRALFWGLIKILLGLLFVYIGLLKRKGSKGAQ